MKEQNSNIEKFSLNITESKHIVLKLIENQINECKLKHLSNWIRDHTISNKETDKKVNDLRLQKEALISFFNEKKSCEILVELNFSISSGE